MVVMLSDIARSGISGLAFGAALSLSRVWLPSVIIDQMRLKDFHMLEVFLTASASSALIMLTLERLGIAKRSVRSNASLNWFSAYDGNVIGGAMVGMGMSLTGACPGTVLVQLVNRVPSSGATALGAVVGGVLYAGFGRFLRGGDSGSRQHTIAERFDIKPMTTFLAFEAVLLAAIAVSTVALPGRSLAMISPVAGGLVIGAAQMLSILLTSKPVGVSTAYEQLGRYFCRAFRFRDRFDSADFPMSVVFAVGVLAGSFAFSSQSTQLPRMDLYHIPISQAVIGGCIMTLGARVAGGCTSGHGLSGLASLSFSSFVTVAAMFATAIGVATLRG